VENGPTIHSYAHDMGKVLQKLFAKEEEATITTISTVH
jgi:hypothetical protein